MDRIYCRTYPTVDSVAPKNITSGSRHSHTAAMIINAIRPETARFCVLAWLASLCFPCPRKIATMVDVPTAKRMDTENRKFTKGDAILTADKATSDTPLATNIPSTIVYSANIHWARTDGQTNLQNDFFSDTPSKFMILLLFIHTTNLANKV